VRSLENSAVNVREDDLRKKAGNGSREPNKPPLLICRSLVSRVPTANAQTVDRGAIGSPSQESD